MFGGMEMAANTTRAEKLKATKKAALNIDATVEIGMTEVSATQAVRISIIRARGKRYTALTRFYRKKRDDMWKPKNGIWIPLEHTGEIADLLARAAEKGREDN